MEATKKRKGWQRPGPGRPAVYGERMKRVWVNLSQEHLEFLQAYGEGRSLSSTAREIIDQFMRTADI